MRPLSSGSAPVALVVAIALTGCSDAGPSSSPPSADVPATGSASDDPRPRHPRSRSVDAQRYEALADHELDVPTEDPPWTFEDLEATLDIVARGRMGEPVESGNVTITVHDVFAGAEPNDDGYTEPGEPWVVLDVEFWRDEATGVSDRALVLADGGSAWGHEMCCANGFDVLDEGQRAKHTGPHRQLRAFVFPEGRTPRYVVFATDEMSYAGHAAIIELAEPDR